MSRQSSSTGFAAVNLLCAIWALKGHGIKGESGLGKRLVPSQAASRGVAAGEVDEWINRAHTYEGSKQFDRFRFSWKKREGRTWRRMEPVFSSSEQFREAIRDIVIYSLAGEPVTKVISHIREGLVRGCALDERGIRLLSKGLNLRERMKEGGLPFRDSEAHEFVEEIVCIIAEASGNRPSGWKRDSRYAPYSMAIKRGSNNYAIMDESQDDLMPYAVASALSALYGGELGWEGGSSKEVVERVFADGPDGANGAQSRSAGPSSDPIKEALPQYLGKRIAAALARRTGSEILAETCRLDNEGAFRGRCEAYLDGLVAAFFVPDEVVEVVGRVFDGEMSWRDALSALVEMALEWARGWADTFSMLDNDYQISPAEALPKRVYGRDDIVGKVVETIQRARRRGAPLGSRIALIGTPGSGRRTIALASARRALEKRLVDIVLEVRFVANPSQTLENLRFIDEKGLIDGRRRREENLKKLKELPPRTLVIISGVAANPASSGDSDEWAEGWDLLTRVGMADLIVTTEETASGESLGRRFVAFSVEPLEEDDLVSIYLEISKRGENTPAIRSRIQEGVDVSEVVAQARADGSPLNASTGMTPFNPDSLRGNGGEMTTELRAMIIAALLPEEPSAEAVDVLLSERTVEGLVSRGWIDEEACLRTGKLREAYRRYCAESLNAVEWEGLCRAIARALDDDLARRVSNIADADPKARATFHNEASCAVSILEALAKIASAREGAPVQHGCYLDLLGKEAKWLGVLSETRRELGVRERRLEALVSLGEERPFDEVASESLRIATLRGKLGEYESAIEECDKMIAAALHMEGKRRLRASDVLLSAMAMLSDGRLLPGELLALVRALRVRGYVCHDLWEENGSRALGPELEKAIKDKRASFELGKRLDEKTRLVEQARTLVTLAYSYYFGGDAEAAIGNAEAAVKTFRVLAKDGGRDERLELASAINSLGFFLSPETKRVGQSVGDLERALRLKDEALRIRMAYLSKVDMDLARSHNNVAISLRDLGRLVEAREHVAKAEGILGIRAVPGESGHTLVIENRIKIEKLLTQRNCLDQIICSRLRGHQGTCSIFAEDEAGGRVVSLRYVQHGSDATIADTVEEDDCEEDVFESGSTIKVFIDAVIQLLISRGEIDEGQMVEYLEEDRVGGSGILKTAEPGGSYRLGDVITWMVAASDNIATNMVIRILGTDRINRLIRELGFNRTKVLHKLDFPRRHDFGVTTAKELGGLLLMLLRGGGMMPGPAAEAVLAHLSKQQSSSILAAGIPPYLINTCDRSESFVSVLSKSGTMNAVRADAGIVKAPWGAYVAVLMAKDFPERMEYADHPSVLALRGVSAFLFDYFATSVLSDIG